MIGTAGECREPIPDGRNVVMKGARMKDAAAHAMFEPIVDVRAGLHDHSKRVAR